MTRMFNATPAPSAKQQHYAPIGVYTIYIYAKENSCHTNPCAVKWWQLIAGYKGAPTRVSWACLKPQAEYYNEKGGIYVRIAFSLK